MSEPCGKCDLFGCDHAPVTASDARPPSDTEATGWHRHTPGARARETIAAPIALARCQDVHANDTGNACRACQSFAQVVALRVLAALGSQEKVR